MQLLFESPDIRSFRCFTWQRLAALGLDDVINEGKMSSESRTQIDRDLEQNCIPLVGLFGDG
jgi:hypothetical protein